MKNDVHTVGGLINQGLLSNVRYITAGLSNAQTVGKEYVVNMMNNRRTLHKNHNPKCYYSSGMYAFIPFNTLEEAEQFQKKHNVAFCKCGNCFPKEGKK